MHTILLPLTHAWGSVFRTPLLAQHRLPGGAPSLAEKRNTWCNPSNSAASLWVCRSIVYLVAPHEIGHAIYSLDNLREVGGGRIQKYSATGAVANSICRWLNGMWNRRCDRLMLQSALHHCHVDPPLQVIKPVTKTLLEEPRAELTTLHSLRLMLEGGHLAQVCCACCACAAMCSVLLCMMSCACWRGATWRRCAVRAVLS